MKGFIAILFVFFVVAYAKKSVIPPPASNGVCACEATIDRLGDKTMMTISGRSDTEGTACECRYITGSPIIRMTLVSHNCNDCMLPSKDGNYTVNISCSGNSHDCRSVIMVVY